MDQLEQKLNQKREFIIKALYYGLWAGICGLILYYGIGLLTPFIFSFIFAYFLRRLAVKSAKPLHLPVRLLCVVYVLLFYSTIGVLISLLGISAVARLAEFMGNLPSFYEDQLQPLLNTLYNNIQRAVFRIDPELVVRLDDLYNQLLASLGTMLSNFSVVALGWISGLAGSVPAFAIKILLMVIATFFAAMDLPRFGAFIGRQLPPRGREIMYHVKDYLTGTLLVVIRAYLLIMSITFVELSIGLTIIGIHNAVLVALSIAIFDILPVFGTGGIMVPWVLVNLIQGNYTMAASLFALYVAITIIRNIIEPKIVGSQLGLHPLVTLMALFAGVQIFGVVGLFGLPIALSLINDLNRKGIIHIFREASEGPRL